MLMAITHVINFDLPMEAENYVHRVGRTGRAGNLGNAISFCDQEEVALLRDIERLIQLPIEVDEEHPFHVPVPSAPKGGTKKSGRKRRGGNGKPRRARANGEGKADFKDKKIAKKGAGKKRGGAAKSRPWFSCCQRWEAS